MFNTAVPAYLVILLLTGTVQAQSVQQIAQGQRLWQKRCTECHALDVDDTGPRHRGVFGRPAGSIKGYDYSRALRQSHVVWDEVSLDRWLTDPEKFLPGQNMDYRVRNKAERAALIAYLKSLSPPAPATGPTTAPQVPDMPGGSTPAPPPAAAPPKG